MDQGKFHTLKPQDWEDGSKCDFQEASAFFEKLGYNPLPLEMKDYKDLDFNSLYPEIKGYLSNDPATAQAAIKQNFEEALNGTGCFGHDYGPVMAMI